MPDINRNGVPEVQEYAHAETKPHGFAKESISALCHFCHADLDSESRYCPECGADSSEKSKTCTVCGSTVAGAFCDSCGAALHPIACPSCGQLGHFPYCTSCGNPMSPMLEIANTSVMIEDCSEGSQARIAAIDLLFSDEETKLRDKLEHRAIILKEKKYFIDREIRIEQWKSQGRDYFAGPSSEELALAKMMSANLAEFGKKWQLRKDEEERIEKAKAEEERRQREELERLRREAKEAVERRIAAEVAAKKAEEEAKDRRQAEHEEILRQAKARELQMQAEAAEAEKKAQAAAVIAKKEAEARQREKIKMLREGFSGRWSGANPTTGYYECLDISIKENIFSAVLYCISSTSKTVERFKGKINPPQIELVCYKIEVLYCPPSITPHAGNFSGTLSSDFRTLTGVWSYPTSGARSYAVLTKSG